MDPKIGPSYLARKALFAKGLKSGRLTIREIEEAVPQGSLNQAERWLLYYSLHSAEVEIVDDEADSPPVPEEHPSPP